MMRPKFIMLVGLPGSGKSTFLAYHAEDFDSYTCVSTDKFIEEYAVQRGLTYDDVWQEAVGRADSSMQYAFQYAVANRNDIVVDRTNLSVKSRRRFLSSLPEEYMKMAVVFSVPDDVLASRLASRPGKTIPEHVVERMRTSYTPPTLDEGFGAVALADHVGLEY